MKTHPLSHLQTFYALQGLIAVIAALLETMFPSHIKVNHLYTYVQDSSSLIIALESNRALVTKIMIGFYLSYFKKSSVRSS